MRSVNASTRLSRVRRLPAESVRALLSSAIAEPRFHMLFLGSFAGIALLLTVVGLYGVMAYSVMQRTREIGVRIAIGANRSMVLGTVLKQAMTMVFAGLVIGLAGAIAAYLPALRAASVDPAQALRSE